MSRAISKVYVVCEDTERDLSSACKYGELCYIYPERHQVSGDYPDDVDTALDNLYGYTANDYLLAVGDPVAIALCAIVAAQETGGRVNILRWDRQAQRYFVVKLDVPLYDFGR
jgi:hypothetical protein